MKRREVFDWQLNLLDTLLTILNYNLQSISISHTRQFNIHALGLLSLLSLTSPLVAASNGAHSTFWVPELSPHSVTLSSGATSTCHWIRPHNF
jgi:hypothetical protein